jgi:hypothetical protein
LLVPMCLFHEMRVVFMINKEPTIIAEPLELFRFDFMAWAVVVSKKTYMPANKNMPRKNFTQYASHVATRHSS